MTIFKYDSANTEGAYPTAMVVEDAEIKKGEKIVATDLVDLYDTDINNPTDGQVLTFATDVWINGEGGSAPSTDCNIFNGFDRTIAVTALSIAAGWGNTLIIKEDGTLWGIGLNDYGQLGTGDTTQVSELTQIGTDSDWVQVSMYYRHACAIKSNGTLWGCGYNTSGQLGVGNYTNQWTFTQESLGVTTWLKVVCGAFNSYALRTDGTLWATGQNTYGQLGIGSTTPKNSFNQETRYSTLWTNIAAGWSHVIASRSDGSLWGCGRNNNYQLGITSGSTYNRFTRESTASTIWTDKIATSYYSSYGVKSNGDLCAAGNNSYGQLGSGGTSTQTTFIKEVTNKSWKNVTACMYWVAAVDDVDHLYGCGSNSSGQLGLGIISEEHTFVQEITNGNWDIIEAGGATLIASALGTGTIYGTGDNDYYQTTITTTVADITTFTGNVQYYLNYIYVDANSESETTDGSFENPFYALEEALYKIRQNCSVITEDVTIFLLSDVYLPSLVSLNHPYGDKITIDGNGFRIFTTAMYGFNVDVLAPVTGSYTLDLYHNHKINIVNALFEFEEIIHDNSTGESSVEMVAESWDYMIDDSIGVRNHSAVVYNDEWYIMSSSGFFKYSFTNDTLTEITPTGATVVPLMGTAMFLYGDDIFFFGGDDPDFSVYGPCLYRYNITSNIYYKLTASVSGDIPTGPWFGCYGVYNGFLYYFSGYDAASYVWKMNLASYEWTIVNSATDCSGRNQARNVVIGTKMYIWGGHNGLTSYRSLWSYDMSNDTWAELSTNDSSSPLGLDLAGVFTDGTDVFVYGGRNYDTNLNYNTIHKFTIATETWSTLPQYGTAGRTTDGHVVTLRSGKLWCHGGCTAYSCATYWFNVYVYDFDPTFYPSIGGIVLNVGNTTEFEYNVPCGMSVRHNSHANINGLYVTNESLVGIHYFVISTGISFAKVTFNYVPLIFENSTGNIDGSDIPISVNVDYNSTLEITDLTQNIGSSGSWWAKNNSFVILESSSSPTINITNENSTIILNDAII